MISKSVTCVALRTEFEYATFLGSTDSSQDPQFRLQSVTLFTSRNCPQPDRGWRRFPENCHPLVRDLSERDAVWRRAGNGGRMSDSIQCLLYIQIQAGASWNVLVSWLVTSYSTDSFSTVYGQMDWQNFSLNSNVWIPYLRDWSFFVLSIFALR